MGEKPNGLRRRSLLSSLGAGAVSTAGCLTTVPSLGQQVRFGEVDEPTAESPTYRDWIPADLEASKPPGALSFDVHRPGQRGENTVGGPFRDRWIKGRLDHVGVDFQSFESLVTVGLATVGRASIDRDHLEETISRTGYEPEGVYEGFDIYRRRSPGSTRKGAVAVEDDVLVFARDGTAALEEVIDTGAGRRPRRHEASDAFARLTDEVGALPVMDIGGGSSDRAESGTAASATGAVFDDTYAYYVRSQVHADESDVDRDEIESRFEASPRALDATRVDVRIDGRVATVVVKFAHETFADLYGPLYGYPLITWGYGYDADAETLTVTHEAGDTVDASLFTLLDTDADEPAAEQFTDLGETIGPGDSLRVDVSGRDEWHVRLDGTVPGADESWTEFNVGDAWFDE